ncbi:MAG TPA: hypothetical protein VG941_02930 [Candidatus Paceibacterota bacterium]|nr:hypothetical protein [Candidatus Paceibacterota bacterium]
MSHKVLKWLIALAVALGVVAALLFYFGSSSFSESRVVLKIDGPTQASVGDEVVYKISYENTTKTTLHDLNFTFTYPDGAVIMKDGSVVNNPSRIETVKSDTLGAGESQTQEYHAFLVGDRGNIKTAKAVLSFNAGSIRSSFEKDATLSTTITSVPVTITAVAPPNASPDQSISYIVDYRNDSANTISGLQLVFTYPDGFVPKRFSPSTSSGQNTWLLKDLAPGMGGRITVDGTLAGREGDSKTLAVTLKRDVNGTLVDYEKTTAGTVISSPLLNVSIVANNAADYISHAGDTLQYTVSYQNNSNYTLSGLVLSAHLEGDMYDFSSVDPRSGFFDSNGHTLTWNSTVIPDFNGLRPRQGGSVVFTIKLKPALSSTASKNIFVHATAALATENVPSDVDGDSVSTQADLITKITSQPTFSQAVYYSDASFGSHGPYPLKAGTETVLTVHWKITNPGNDLGSAKLTATLPQGAVWKSVTSVPAGLPEPTFNKNTSQIIWTLGTIPQNVGINSVPYELVFQVGVTPSTTQVGQPFVILQSPSLSGVDNFTKQTIVVPGGNLTSNETADRPNQGAVTQ